MQNSALGALLATLHFPDPLTPVPCAISACTHSIVGSGIAAYWRLTDVKEGAHDQAIPTSIAISNKQPPVTPSVSIRAFLPDRLTCTPWLVVIFHNPWYTAWGGFKMEDCNQRAFDKPRVQPWLPD